MEANTTIRRQQLRPQSPRTRTSVAKTVTPALPAMSGAYSVDTLMERVGADAKLKLWQRFDKVVVVEGKVGKIKSFPAVTFFELHGSEGRITVQCPTPLQPVIDQKVHVEGIVTLRPAIKTGGFDLVLQGRPLQQVPKQRQELIKLELDKTQYVRLADYLGQFGSAHFGVVGSSEAVATFRKDLPAAKSTLFASYSLKNQSKEMLIADIKRASEHCEALAILQDESDKSYGLWNEPEVVQALLNLKIPFYVAVRQGNRLTLTDQYADESFLSPERLAQALTKILADLQQRQQLRQSVDDLQSSRSKLEQAYGEAKRSEQRFKNGMQKLSLDLKRMQDDQRTEAIYMRETYRARLWGVVSIFATVSIICIYLLR